MLTEAQKTAVRRHLGVPFAGTAQAGRLAGYRFTWFNEDLEYRMNNLQASEEALLTGVTIGSFRIDGRPTAGDVLTFTLTDANRVLAPTYTVQPSDLVRPPNTVNPAQATPTYAIALGSALAARPVIAPYGYAPIGVSPGDAFAPAYLPPYFAQLVIMGPTSSPFTLSASSTGTTNLLVTDPGTTCPVAVSVTNAATGQPQIVYGYIALLDALALGSATTDLSLSYDKADVVTFRHDEARARRALYRQYCAELMRIMGGAEYVRKFGGGSSAGATA